MDEGISLGLVMALVEEATGADPAVIEQAVQDWLEEHPEATTTVADGSITEQKLAAAVAAKINQVNQLSDEIDDINSEFQSLITTGTVNGTKNLVANDLINGLWSSSTSIISQASYRVRTKNAYQVKSGESVNVTIASGFKVNLIICNEEPDGVTSQTPASATGFVTSDISYTAQSPCWAVVNIGKTDNSSFSPSDAVSGVTITVPASGKSHSEQRIDTLETQIDENTSHRQWIGKNWSQYGDSISTYAIFPSSLDGGWAVIPNNYQKFNESYMRGIGGQSFAYGSHGGSVAFINADGSLNSVNQTTNYDDYSGTVPSGTTKSRGALCSWLRITSMFPVSMKDNVDLVLVMGGTNDAANSTAPTWVENSATDAEWAASEYYADYGGDYNINTLQGGVASTIMKMHVWMPNALIVIGTPINGRTDATGEKKPGTIPTEYEKANQIIEASRMFGANVIDVFGGCGINVANSDEYISDGVHPNSAGRKLLGSFIAGELNRIMPHM